MTIVKKCDNDEYDHEYVFQIKGQIGTQHLCLACFSKFLENLESDKSFVYLGGRIMKDNEINVYKDLTSLYKIVYRITRDKIVFDMNKVLVSYSR